MQQWLVRLERRAETTHRAKASNMSAFRTTYRAGRVQLKQNVTCSKYYSGRVISQNFPGVLKCLYYFKPIYCIIIISLVLGILICLDAQTFVYISEQLFEYSLIF